MKLLLMLTSYTVWCCQAQRPPNVLVTFYSSTNRTAQLASAIAHGAREQGASVRLQSIADTDVPADVLQWADAVIIGMAHHRHCPHIPSPQHLHP